MNRVVLLGAGASAGAALPRPLPTILTFFRHGYELGLNREDRYKELFKFIEKQWGIKEGALCDNHPQVTIEVLLTFFDIEQRLYPIDSRIAQDKTYRDCYHNFQEHGDRLKEYVGEVFLRSSACSYRDGCDRHFEIARNLDESDCVISFNYDLVMDNALKRTKRWNERTGYAPMVFQRYYDVGHWYETPTDPPSSALKYLKLHGSLNWFKSTGTGVESVSDEIDKLIQDTQHPQRRMISLFSASIKRPYKHSDIFDGPFVENLIVPPTIHKEYGSFRELWFHALEALSTAQELIIIGFSFTPADRQAEWLLRRGFARNRGAVKITMVDPSREARQRIRTLVNDHPILAEYETLEDFCDALLSAAHAS